MGHGKQRCRLLIKQQHLPYLGQMGGFTPISWQYISEWRLEGKMRVARGETLH